MEKICWQITVAAFMQPLQYDLQSPAAKDNSITHAATAWSNLDAAITMRSAETELQNTIELRATASEIVAPKPDLDARAFEALFKRIFRRKITSAKNAFRARLPSKLHRQLIHQHHLQSHLHCGNDPTVANHNGILSTAHARKTLETPFTMRNRSDHGLRMIRPWSENDPTTHETVSHPSHRRGRSSTFGDALCPEKHRVSCICYLSKTHSFRARLPSKLHRQLLHQHHLQSHLQWGNHPRVANHNGIPSATHPPAPLAIPFTLRERSYSCKSQWNSVDRKCTKHRWHPIYNAEPIRPWSETDPTMIRPHTRPSRTRRTAEVDHRRSGTHFVWKNTGFRASAISQKRISCETSFKTPSATPPPAPLAIPCTVRNNFFANSFCD